MLKRDLQAYLKELRTRQPLANPHWDWLQPYLSKKLRATRGDWGYGEWLEELEDIAERCDAEPWNNGIDANDFEDILVWIRHAHKEWKDGLDAADALVCYALGFDDEEDDDEDESNGLIALCMIKCLRDD